jgi:hypothetical protein
MALNPPIKNRVRGELFRCAIQGRFLTYTDFFNLIHPGATMGSFPYQTHFDAIAKEERNNGYPDITFIVHGINGYPSQVNFVPFDSSNSTQLNSLRTGTDALIAMYCPGAQNPY